MFQKTTIMLLAIMAAAPLAWGKWTYYKDGDPLPGGGTATYKFLSDGNWILKGSMRGGKITVEQAAENGILDLSTIWDDIDNETDDWKNLFFSDSSRFTIQDCAELKELVLPSTGVTKYANGLFQNNPNLEKVSGTAAVTNIGSSVFHNCPKLTMVSADFSHVQSIGMWAFATCMSLTGDLYFPELVTLSYQAFYNPNKGAAGGARITSFVAPKLKVVNAQAFYGNDCLTNVVISPEATSLGTDAFGYCTALAYFSPELLPKTMPLSNFNAMRYCTALHQKLTITSDNVSGDYDFTGKSPGSHAGFSEVDMSGCTNQFAFSDAFGYCESLEKIWFPPNQTNYICTQGAVTAPTRRLYITGVKPMRYLQLWAAKHNSYAIRVYYDPKMDSAWRTNFTELTSLTDAEKARADFPTDLEPGEVVTGTWNLSGKIAWCIKYVSPCRPWRGLMLLVR